MARLLAENLLVLGVVLAALAICAQIVLMPLIFSELDSIMMEFDEEIRDVMEKFDSSYQSLASIQQPSTRREREAAAQQVADATSDDPKERIKRIPFLPLSKNFPTLSPHPIRTSPFNPLKHRPAPTQRPTFAPYRPAKHVELNPESSEFEEEGDDYEEIDDIPSIGTSPRPINTRHSGRNVPNNPNPVPNNPVQTASRPVSQKPLPLPICPLEENRCPPGPPGPPGQRGGPGIAGVDGSDGVRGGDALDELTAEYPSFCTNCPAGPDGKPGVPGSTGKPGMLGAAGVPGINGKNGQPGIPGGYGAPGKQGLVGGRGMPGHVGQDGVVLIQTKGPKGPAGKQGESGQAGEDGTNNNSIGQTGITGQPGRDGKPGRRGAKGKRGDIGPRGTPGLGTECKCADMMKQAISLAQNTAYIELERAMSVRTAAAAGTEVRRSPVKKNIPTLEQVRELIDRKFAIDHELAAQEDSKVVKFAAAPHDELPETERKLKTFAGVQVLESSDPQLESLRQMKRGPTTIMSPPPTAPTATNTSTTIQRARLRSVPTGKTIRKQKAVRKSETGFLTIPAGNFTQTRIPSQIYPASFLKSLQHRGHSHQKSSSTWNHHEKKDEKEDKIRKTRKESKSAEKRTRLRVKKIRHSRTSLPVQKRRLDTTKRVLDSEKAFQIEKEIARNSDKKIVDRKKDDVSVNIIDLDTAVNTNKRLKRVNLKPAKRVHRLTPTQQQQHNSNILENIARSLGVVVPEQSKRNTIKIQ